MHAMSYLHGIVSVGSPCIAVLIVIHCVGQYKALVLLALI